MVRILPRANKPQPPRCEPRIRLNPQLHEMNLPDHKRKIILDAAAWCAFSSTRSGCPIKSREHIYPILDQICFEDVLDEEKGAISKDQFNTWHKAECLKVSSALERTKKLEKDSMIGWAAKIINVYLKIACYLGGLGREGLVRWIKKHTDENRLLMIENEKY